jgi:Homing endonuclease associated repeat
MPCKPWPRWTDERILAAVHAWAAETGEPPRSYEWSPGTARSLGLVNGRVAKWERERPRWPDSDTLRYHFGRFNLALQAAGLAAFRTCPTNVNGRPHTPRGHACERVSRPSSPRPALS